MTINYAQRDVMIPRLDLAERFSAAVEESDARKIRNRAEEGRGLYDTSCILEMAAVLTTVHLHLFRTFHLPQTRPERQAID